MVNCLFLIPKSADAKAVDAFLSGRLLPALNSWARPARRSLTPR
jgi:hypothetical protein